MTGNEPLKEFFCWLSGFNQVCFLFISIIAELFRIGAGFIIGILEKAEEKIYSIRLLIL